MVVRKSRLSFEIDSSQIRQAELDFRALGDALQSLARRKTTVKHPSVEKFRANATRKMFNLAYAVALTVYDSAVENTPQGNEARIGTDKEYTRMYRRRLNDHGVDMVTGFHKGTWSYSNVKNITFNPAVRDLEEARRDFVSQFIAGYQLGETFYVSAHGTAFRQMEKGFIRSAPDGVYRPTVASIMQSYAGNVLAAYNMRKRDFDKRR